MSIYNPFTLVNCASRLWEIYCVDSTIAVLVINFVCHNVWSEIGESNSFHHLGRVRHNQYANLALSKCYPMDFITNTPCVGVQRGHFALYCRQHELHVCRAQSQPSFVETVDCEMCGKLPFQMPNTCSNHKQTATSTTTRITFRIVGSIGINKSTTYNNNPIRIRVIITEII